ncbi:hypothetical protein [Exiguobacterium sp. SL-10]|nr:hypothetical protein [Exiguobacterium sp. SL-10]
MDDSVWMDGYADGVSSLRRTSAHQLLDRMVVSTSDVGLEIETDT